MSKVKIVQYGNPILEEKSLEVGDPKSKETHELVDRMYNAVKSYGDGAAGLSAPQIGILQRVAICRRMDLENKESGNIWEVMINPVIKKQSKELSTKWEGCLSINFGDLFGEVSRPREVEVEYYNLKGEKQSLNAKDYLAHIIQHEIDHLNGILFLKYVSDPSELKTSDELENN
jgi:peptide deformylase